MFVAHRDALNERSPNHLRLVSV